MSLFKLFRTSIILTCALVALPSFSYAASNCVTLTQTLSLGSSGDEVTLLQQFLRQEYGSAVLVTGKFGTITEGYVKRWQNERGIVSPGLPGSGTVGVKTRAAMACSSASSPSSSTSVGSTASAVSTTTFANGINITNGCFAIQNRCITGANALGISFGSQTNPPINSPAPSTNLLAVTGGSPWNLVGNAITYAGNVGIGTSNPGRQLDVVVGSSASINNGVRVKGYQAAFEVLNQNATQNWYFGVDDADGNKLKIGRGYSAGQNVTPSIVVGTDNSVNVGNGTPPGAAFNVSSSYSAAGGDWVAWFRREGGVSTHIRVQNYSTGNPEAVISGLSARGSLASPSPVLAEDNLFILDARGYDGSGTDYTEYAPGWSDGQASIIFSANETWSNGSHGAKINFYTTPNGAVQQLKRVTIGANGNVGIGTGNPTQTLDVIGNVKIGSGSTPSGITLYDKATRQPYCVSVTNGTLGITAGVCN